MACYSLLVLITGCIFFPSEQVRINIKYSFNFPFQCEKSKMRKRALTSSCPLSSILVVLVMVLITGCMVTFSHYKLKKDYENMMKLSTYKTHIRMRREITKYYANGEQDRHRIVKRNSGSSQLPNSEPTALKAGSAYTRWGRRDCPAGAVFVYTGYAAGSHQSHPGGGANYLCIYNNITYQSGDYYNGYQFPSYLYGLEWKSAKSPSNELFDFSEVNSNDMLHKALTCSLCLATGRTTHMVMTGRKDCPAGWHYEYSGFIMTGGHSDKHSSEHICVDKTPHAVVNSEGDQGGSHLHIVETSCTSLPCGPIVIGRELKCVVCSI